MIWSDIITQAHETAVNHGFWENNPCYEHLAMLVITELSEAVDADRHGRHADRDAYIEQCDKIRKESKNGISDYLKFKKAFDVYVKDSVEDELADACIRIMDMMGHYEMASANISDNAFMACTDKPLCEFCFRVTEALLAHLGEKYALLKALDMIIAYAKRNKIDLMWHIRKKMEYNASRPMLNGKKY